VLQSIDQADNLSSQHSVLIVGGLFRTVDGRVLVQKRSWEMLRIFSDQLAEPIFLMYNAQTDRTLEYELPEKATVITHTTTRGKFKLVKTILGTALSNDVKRAINTSTAVYLRQPLWECWDVFKYARANGKKILVSFHGDWPEMLRQTQGSTWKKVTNHLMARYIGHIYNIMAVESIISFFVGDALQNKYGNLAKQEIVFANFLHSKNEISSHRPVSNMQPYKILFVGQFEEYKGIEYLIRAIALLKNEKIDLRLMLIGTGPLKHQLCQLVQRLGLKEEIEWCGYVQHGTGLMALYRQADLFVLPSVSGEGTPKVLMEAMSQGVPVIATDVGNSRNLLKNGHYGLVLPPADDKALFSAIHKLLAKPDLRSAFAQKGLELARISTRERQMEIVREGLQKAIPEALGKPDYLQ
jgi:glycosyltransferase involved in cell wall biosynthesis